MLTPQRMRDLVLRMMSTFASGKAGTGRRYWHYRKLYDRLTLAA